MLLRGLLLALGSSLPVIAYAADAPPPAASSGPETSISFYNPAAFELRGGFLDTISGREGGTPDFDGELVFPKFASVPGWQDVLIPRLHVGGMDNLDGRTSYAYAGALWTVNFDRIFTEAFIGGAVHNGQLVSTDPNEASLGCRELYHVGGNLGYRFSQSWSAMVTLDHVSNGRGVLSNCPANSGLTLVGLRVGYAF